MKPLTFGLVAFTAISAASIIPAAAATQQADPGCHAAYVQCLPPDHDVDCKADKLPPIQLKQIGVDPYRLDRNKNGIGCEIDEDAPPMTTPPVDDPAPPTVAPKTPTTKAPAKPPAAVKARPRFTG